MFLFLRAERESTQTLPCSEIKGRGGSSGPPSSYNEYKHKFKLIMYKSIMYLYIMITLPIYISISFSLLNNQFLYIFFIH